MINENIVNLLNLTAATLQTRDEDHEGSLSTDAPQESEDSLRDAIMKFLATPGAGEAFAFLIVVPLIVLCVACVRLCKPRGSTTENQPLLTTTTNNVSTSTTLWNATAGSQAAADPDAALPPYSTALVVDGDSSSASEPSKAAVRNG